jgi:hypothetical protein
MEVANRIKYMALMRMIIIIYIFLNTSDGDNKIIVDMH